LFLITCQQQRFLAAVRKPLVALPRGSTSHRRPFVPDHKLLVLSRPTNPISATAAASVVPRVFFFLLVIVVVFVVWTVNHGHNCSQNPCPAPLPHHSHRFCRRRPRCLGVTATRSESGGLKGNSGVGWVDLNELF
jgi:hypothetical protein